MTQRDERLYERVVALRLEIRTYVAIAQITGAPIGTVCSILKRERKHNAALADVTRRLEEERRSGRRPRFVDDPRAKLPDYGRLPLPPAAEVHRSSTWLIRIEET